MSMPRDLKDFMVYVDGEYAGECESGSAPKLSYKVEEWIGGGMAGPVEIDQHLEKLSCEWSPRGFKLSAYAQMGRRNLGAIGLRFAGAYARPDTGEVDSVEHIMRGTHREIDGGELKRGAPGQTKVTSTCTTYELRVNGAEVIFVDMINGIERYDGVDVRAGIRQALGL
jgi:uncharacterized protein